MRRDAGGSTPSPSPSAARGEGNGAPGGSLNPDAPAERVADGQVLSSPRVVADVLAAVRGTSLTDLDVEWDGGSLRLKREVAARAAPAATAAPAAASEDVPTLVRSPYVGIFHRDENRGYPEPGDHVGEQTRLAEVETLGILNAVLAGVEGVLVELLVADLTPVEYGQPLARIRPEARQRG